MIMFDTQSILSRIAEADPSVVIPATMLLGADVLYRAQSVPGASPFTIGWPGLLISLLTRNRTSVPVELPCTVINAKSGHARTNRSPLLEHLLRSHGSAPSRRGLAVTFLHTSERPGAPSRDAVVCAALSTILVQVIAAGVLFFFGVGSQDAMAVTIIGTLLANAAGLILRHQQQKELRSTRAVPEKRRDVICITGGNGSSEAIVVVSEGGGVRIEDLAAGRASTLGVLATLGVVALLILWMALLVFTTTLRRVDAWLVLAQCALGAAYTVYAARTWRCGAALGFKFAEEKTMVVRADKVMEALAKAEEVESGVGATLLPIYFPGKLRPEEELWWAQRKQAPRAAS
ncbi:hypothetical protein BN946_scf184943.g65 [Trametes cinnabarina]|uniref:Uncharacterized protein n=1 Tax=Pycnoporus cinnabarinus TaxID=5643 RepID=A0A060SCD9_PYCCI|nr:hypothetical protein BN946_scf184943.g65 [Trametes cinnabarina]